ncbi:hypothetical protein K2173_000031 [Erythroxylum novogranatense]|uniref:8-amino-7-oxononanoate synthase n=1 Tax=Erythroxylum novogranatense TaxID=1862640 RepID=A0AAV8SND4_9ROSI|nr:hypothetical protein K2173_000031 [Erythroxylum novogranatense]
MITLKAVSFSPTSKLVFFHSMRPPNYTKSTILCLCRPNDSEPEEASASPPEGDIRKQELLARIAMLQAQKVRLTDYLDDRAAYLTQFAEEANADFDKVGEDALKGLEEASARIMGNIESKMQAFEESQELNRVEIEKNDNKLAEFEGKMEKDRNEGLFFKNLSQKPPVDKAKAKQEADKIKDLTKAKAGSKIRKNIYLVLIGVLVIIIADSFISSVPDWRKVAVLGAILVGLITQLSYEQSLSSELESMEKENTKKEAE